MRRRHALLFTIALFAACSAPQDDERLGTAEDAITVCPTGTTLEGVDVSHYDGAINWAQVKASGRAFAFAKATEGTTYTDPTFATNWSGMKAAGIVRSAYHFFHCDTTPAAQAAHFIAVMPALQAGDLPPTLDFEDTTTCTSATAISLAVQWLDAVAQATGTLPIIYTSPGILGGFANTGALAGHAQLWVANWGVSCPNVPSPFTTWPFWQYSDSGTVPGIPGATSVDLDKFNGTLAQLQALTVGGSSSSSSSSSSTTTSSSSGTPPPSCQVNGVSGTCIDVSVCAAMPGYHSTAGLCPGPVTEECCTPTGSSSSSSSSSTTTSSSTAASSSSSTTSTSSAGGAGGGTTSTSSSGTTTSTSSAGGMGGAATTTTSSGGTGAAGTGGVATSTSSSGGTGAAGAGFSNNAASGCSTAGAGDRESFTARGWLVALALAAFVRRPRRRARAH